MLSRFVTAILAGLPLAGATPAFADPQMKADQIVEFFTKEGSLGAARGICIGTAQECDESAQRPAGLDMLINFELDSAELSSEAQQTLREFAKALNDSRLTSTKFVVEGHTDARGTDEYNLQLSERRAQAVTEFLLAEGVSSEKVEAIGLGKTSPRVTDPLDAINRRVEMRISVE